MTLKGTFNAETAYSVGDVVKYTDGNVYHLISAAPAGTDPTNTRYWGQVDQQHQKEAVLFSLDAVGLADAALEALETSLEALEASLGALEERVAALEPDETEPDETEP